MQLKATICAYDETSSDRECGRLIHKCKFLLSRNLLSAAATTNTLDSIKVDFSCRKSPTLLNAKRFKVQAVARRAHGRFPCFSFQRARISLIYSFLVASAQIPQTVDPSLRGPSLAPYLRYFTPGFVVMSS